MLKEGARRVEGLKGEKILKNKRNIAIMIGIICFLLAVGIAIQIKTIKKTSTAISTNASENSLRDEVLKWKEKYDNAYKDLDRTEKELERKREMTAKESAESSSMQEELIKANKILGLSDVTGKGITLTLDDNKDGSTGSLMQYIIHDTDIIGVVNELKAAGAEAISINDQRIVPTTQITCVGPAILINGERIPTPYTIKAIGKPEYLESSLNQLGGYLDMLRNDRGIIANVKKSNNITINKFEGVINMQNAKYAD